MKKLLYPFLALFLFAAASCSSDDDSNSAGTIAQVTSTVTSGTWKVTTYTESGVDHLSYFSGYNFTFASGGVLTAVNGTNTYTGVWSVTSDDSSDDDNPSGDLDFNIAFASPSNFAELTEDWEILERSDTRLKLRHVSGGDNSTDVLIFEKN